MDIDEFVALSVKHNASDLHLCAGHPPMLRIDGELQPLAAAPTLTIECLYSRPPIRITSTVG